MRIILASESRFRKRAMDLLGLPYETSPSGIDEKAIRDPDPARLTQKLAEAKARHVGGRYPDAVIVAGDAVAVKGNKIYEKPVNNDEAARFLKDLSGSGFQFVTSLVVLNTSTGKLLSAVETSNITFRSLTEHEIHAYIRQYAVLNYAGAFESDAVLKFADHLSGSYNFVTALPVSRLIVFLRESGIDI
jgi:septum formation protein